MTNKIQLHKNMLLSNYRIGLNNFTIKIKSVLCASNIVVRIKL